MIPFIVNMNTFTLNEMSFSQVVEFFAYFSDHIAINCLQMLISLI